MAKAGRPELYTPEIAEKIVERLSNGETLIEICNTDGIPSRASIFRWYKSHPEFEAQCARARTLKGEVFESKAVAIAEAVLRGELDHKAGQAAANIYQWAAKVNCPKMYSDRVQHSNADEKPFEIEVKSDKEVINLFLQGVLK